VTPSLSLCAGCLHIEPLAWSVPLHCLRYTSNMCDDLIVNHFFKSSVNGSTKMLTETADAHVFFQNPPLNLLWIFLPPTFEPGQVDEWLHQLLGMRYAGKGFDGWSLNAYHKDVALKIYKDWHATSFDTLYEMRLGVPPQDWSRNSCPPGFVLREDPTFRKSVDAQHTSATLVEEETTLTVIDEQTSQVAGVITFLADDETKRIYISNLEVFPSYRRRGLAKALVQQSYRWVEEGHTIWLTVFTENIGAVAMYFGLGFVLERCLWVVGGANP